MLNRTACREVLEFLDAIEGHGYGGMASFESARLHARIALEMFDKQRAARQDGGEAELRTAAELVVSTFKKDLEQGYRTKDKEFAIDILSMGLKLSGYEQ